MARPKKYTYDPNAWMHAKSIMEMFGLDFDKLLKLKNSIASQNKVPTHLVLPQPEIMGLKIEFCPRAIAPGIRFSTQKQHNRGESYEPVDGKESPNVL